MSKFEVKPDELTKYAGALDEYSRLLGNIGNDVMNVKSRLDFSQDIQRTVNRSLESIVAAIQKESSGCGNMSSGLTKVASNYRKTEEQICGKAKISWDAVVKGSGTKSDESKDNSFDIPEWLYKIAISAAGPAGVVVDSIRQGVEGEWGKVSSDLLKLVGGAVKNSDGSKIDWGKWFDIAASDKTPWEQAVGKYTIDFSSWKNSVSTACNWAAQIAASAYSNYQEFGNFATRFWEETAAETLLKVGEGVLVTAGVSALIAAAGISAPALAVGAAAAGVTVLVDWGLDSIVSWATGGTQTSWVEAASDFICDTGEKVVDWVKDTGTQVVNAAKEGWNSAVSAVQNFFGSGCSWGSLSFG